MRKKCRAYLGSICSEQMRLVAYVVTDTSEGFRTYIDWEVGTDEDVYSGIIEGKDYFDIMKNDGESPTAIIEAVWDYVQFIEEMERVNHEMAI